MKPYKLNIKTKSKVYPIFIGKDIIKNTNFFISKNLSGCKKIFIIIDSNVPKKFIISLKKSLNKFEIFFIKIKVNEKLKNFSTVNKIINILLNKNFYRNDCIIALGGGILGDISAFSASIVKRGIKFINIPTTLLSQVDSSIGGKTGINSKFGKNLIGTFYQPDLVIADIDTIKSLPKREIICGYAEILKHALILNKKFFIWLNKNGKKIIELNNETLIKKAIYESCKIKSKIVKKDETEKNIRKILNFGHTFAHAFEGTKNFSKIINHGEAVLLGIICACEFANLNNLLSYSELKLIKNHFLDHKLNNNIKKYFSKKDVKKILFFMKADKKNFNNKINLILIKKIGQHIRPITFDEFKVKKFLLKKLS